MDLNIEMNNTILTSNNEEDTIKIGETFAEKLKLGDIVALYGDLGAGKTEFIKGVCNYFEVKDIVTSPTFTIMNHYIGSYDGDELDIYHLDLYRIKSIEELENIGFSECIYSQDTIKLIEWAEKADNILVENATYSIKIEQDDKEENKRTITIEG
jgi:tRNA threonylcarbamoyladenosine biosynthesis protein TsaE